MAAVQPWHRVLRYGALALGVYHGKYAYDQLAVIRANERKVRILEPALDLIALFRKKSKSPRLTWSRLTSPTSLSRKRARR